MEYVPIKKCEQPVECVLCSISTILVRTKDMHIQALKYEIYSFADSAYNEMLLNLKLALHNIRIKGKIDVNLKQFFFAYNIKQQISNIVASQKTWKKGKSVIFSTFNVTFFLFLNKGPCIFVLHWALPIMQLALTQGLQKFIEMVKSTCEYFQVEKEELRVLNMLSLRCLFQNEILKYIVGSVQKDHSNLTE